MKKGILLLAFLLAICCGSGLYAQNVSCKSYYEVVETNDENHRLDEVAIYPPVFGTLPEGKRLKIKVCNNDEKKLKKAFFYVYYKNKRVSKLLLPDLKKGETYEFCVNIHSKMTRKDRQELLFKIRRGKTYISYRIAQPHNKKGY